MSDGLRISNSGTAYELSGRDGAPAVALIHGLGLTMRTWDSFAPALAAQFKVLRYDLCGHGQSRLPDETPSLTVLAQQLVTLLDELEIDRCALVGFSLGGMINRRFAIDYPRHASALAILNSPHERSPEAQRLVEERATQTAAGGIGATLDETLARWFTPGFREAHPEAVAQIARDVLANDPANYARHRQVLAEGVKELIRPQPPLTHPTLVMTCEHDSGSTPAMTHAIASEIAGAEAIIVPALQHLGLLEQPALFTRPVADFLARALR